MTRRHAVTLILILAISSIVFTLTTINAIFLRHSITVNDKIGE